MLLGTLGTSLLENLLTGRGINREGKGKGIIRAGERIVRAGYGNIKMDFLYRLILQRFLKYQNIIKMNLSLMVLFLEIIYQK